MDIRRTGGIVDIDALFRAAIDKGSEGVAVMERLLAVRRELNAEAAKAAFDKSLAEFQMECPAITKTKGVPDKNGRIAYRYSPFEEILRVVRPVMRQHGFSFTLDTDTESAQNWVIATCKITHEMGHSEVSRAKFPLGTKTQIMSDTQQYAAALTFASRRVFCNSLGLVTSGEDKDAGNGAETPRGPSNKPETPEEAKKRLTADLWAKLADVRGEANTWTEAVAWLKRNAILTMNQKIADLDAAALTIALEKADIALGEGR